MTGLKQRILGRRSASPPSAEGPSPADPQAAPADVSAEASPPSPSGTSPAPAALAPDDMPTISHTLAAAAVAPAEQPAPTVDAHPAAPAGAEPVVIERPSFRERGRMRRRLRYLRRAHELGLRDLGGLVFDLRRFRRQRFDLVETKLQTLTAVDREMRALATALDDERPVVELRQAGISTCPRCGDLTASDANFCANCGLQIGETPPVAIVPTPPTTPAVAAAQAPAVARAPAVSAAAAGSTPLQVSPAPAHAAAADGAEAQTQPGTASADPRDR